MLTLRLLDRSQILVDYLDLADAPAFSKRVNEIGEITCRVPKGDIKLPSAAIGNFIQIWQHDKRLVTGRISTRDVGETYVSISALTEEISLEANLCPADYTPALANLDLAALAREMLDGWHALRVNTKEKWSQGVVSGVDVSAQPGKLLLNKVDGRYTRNGYVWQRFKAPARFRGWDRIRWSSDFDPPVKTTMQFRTGNSDAEANTKPWTPQTVTSEPPKQPIFGVRGARPSTLGYALSGLTAPVLDVRLNLYTDDTEAADPDGNPTGVTPVVYGLEAVARTHGVVNIGSIPEISGKTVNVEANQRNALAILRDACLQAGWEFRVIEGKLELAESFGRNLSSELLLSNKGPRGS